MILLPDNPIFRLVCLIGALLLILSMFWVGSKPIAVGLFAGQMDKVAHFGTFGLIAALLWLSIQRVHALLVIAIVSAIGAADEFHQRFLPGRSASLEDLAADIFAATVIVFLMKYARRHSS